MLFGHGSWNTFHADTNQVFKAPTKYRQPRNGEKTNAPRNCAGGDKPTYTIYKLPQEINGRKYGIDFTEGGKGRKTRAELSLASAKASAANPPASWGLPSGYWIDLTHKGSSNGGAPRWSSATPVNGSASAWSEWSECVGGKKTRTRTAIAPSCGGKEFTGALKEGANCCSDPNAWEHTDGSCRCNDGYQMDDDGVCIETPTTTDDGTTITSDDEQDSIDTGDTTSSGTDDGTDDGTDTTATTTQTSDVTIVSAGASSGMSTGKKVMVGVLVVGVIGGAVYYRSKKM